MPKRFEARRRKLIQSLRSTGADALLVTNFTNVTYLTGFSGDDSYLLIGPDVTVLISDSRYSTQIAEECPGLDVFIRHRNVTITEATVKVVGKSKLGRLGIESTSMTVAEHEALGAGFKRTELVLVAGLVETLRMIKDSSEIEELRKAIAQAERGFDVLKASLRPELSELQVSHDLEHAIRGFGGAGVSFPPIVAVGARAALPHAHPTNALIGDADFVLVDWGACSHGGYRSDLTRVLVTGRILPKLEKIYKIVLKAQLAAIRKIRPGVNCSDVDAAARRVIDAAGFGKQFGHGLGHGIGLDIHEQPRFAATSKDVLKPGMVITVEPGIYLPGWGGVRIEDDILVTRDGCEVMTSVPKRFEDTIINMTG